MVGEVYGALPELESSFVLAGDDVPGMGSHLVGVGEVLEPEAIVEK